MLFAVLPVVRAAMLLRGTIRSSTLARASLLAASWRSSIVSAVTGVGGGGARRPPPRRLANKAPSAYNSMLPSGGPESARSAKAGGAAAASAAAAAAAAEDDLDPLPGLSLEVCGAALPLGELRVSFPGCPSPLPALLLRVPCSVDALMDAYIGAGNGDADPYWCRPWPSGLALGALLLHEPELVRGKRVLDLGCGAGVAGIAAALAGAREVVLADRDPAAAECAALSARASLEMSTLDGSSQGAGGCSVSSRVVDWDSVADPRRRGRGGGPSPRFDVVLASDVLYDASAALPLSRALRALARLGGEGAVLVADPARRAPRHRAAFAEEVARPKRRERDAGDPHLVLESWEAVDEVSGERAGGGAAATGAVLLMRLRSAGGSSSLNVRWP